jgi:hypothetical protein
MANPVKINKTVIVDMVILIPELYYAGNAFPQKQKLPPSPYRIKPLE